MTDEEIDDLAEALDMACQSVTAQGGRIGGNRSAGCMCPFGAWLGGWRAMPMTSLIAELTKLDECDVTSFTSGFDHPAHEPLPWQDPRLFNLGRQFRERYP